MKTLVLSIISGAVLAFVGTFLISYTSAMAVPSFLVDQSRYLKLLWELAITQFLGFGLITFIVVFLVNRLGSVNLWLFTVATLIICELTLAAMSSFSLVLYASHVIVMFCSAFIGAYLAHKKRINS